MLLQKELKDFAKEIGADLIGIAPVSRLAAAPAGHRPEDYLPGCQSVISLAVRVNTGAVKGLPKTRDQYMLEYSFLNADLYRLSQRVTRYLEDHGYESIGFTPDLANPAVMKADLSHKHAAVACGLGTFGAHELLVNPQYRASLRLATVITEAAFDAYDEMQQENSCDLCGVCIQACPAKALGNWEGEFAHQTGYTIEKERCSYYQNTVLGGKRCGICLKVCLDSHKS